MRLCVNEGCGIQKEISDLRDPFSEIALSGKPLNWLCATFDKDAKKKIVPTLIIILRHLGIRYNNTIVALHVLSNPHCAAKITRSLRSLVLLNGTIWVALDV